MKRFVKIFFVYVVLSALLFGLSVVGMLADKAENDGLTAEFIRLHIRAASDSERDQTLKLAVRDELLCYTTSLLVSAENGKEALACLEAALPQMTALCEAVLTENGSDEPVTVRLDREYFEYREYDGFYLPAGEYNALIVEIGEGTGHNWWCVVFPAVCLSGSSGQIKTDTEKVPVKFRLSDRPTTGEIRFESWLFTLLRRLLA